MTQGNDTRGGRPAGSTKDDSPEVRSLKLQIELAVKERDVVQLERDELEADHKQQLSSLTEVHRAEVQSLEAQLQLVQEQLDTASRVNSQGQQMWQKEKNYIGAELAIVVEKCEALNEAKIVLTDRVHQLEMAEIEREHERMRWEAERKKLNQIIDSLTKTNAELLQQAHKAEKAQAIANRELEALRVQLQQNGDPHAANASTRRPSPRKNPPPSPTLLAGGGSPTKSRRMSPTERASRSAESRGPMYDSYLYTKHHQYLATGKPTRRASPGAARRVVATPTAEASADVVHHRTDVRVVQFTPTAD